MLIYSVTGDMDDSSRLVWLSLSTASFNLRVYAIKTALSSAATFIIALFGVLKQTQYVCTTLPASQTQPSAAARKDGMIKSWAEKRRHRDCTQTMGPGSVALCLVFLMGKLALTCSEYVVRWGVFVRC